jgi:hypothetical protein
MTASELVKKLNEMVKEHGDLMVEMDDAEWGACPISDVVLDKGEGTFNTFIWAENRPVIGKVSDGRVIYRATEEFNILLIK